MKMNRALSVLLVLGATGFALVGCDDQPEVASPTTCGDVCNRYQACVNSTFDVEACAEECNANAEGSQSRQARLEECNTCLVDKSCVEGTFQCATECVGLISVR